ncbi:hypothetical protein ACSRUE_16670 [Sorangium sp. KYC3313]|uniref:hypothetical protein n=1 Tax=Sorangium sp. KYC3313 TaxID=3449740 RepID=UPI003F891695
MDPFEIGEVAVPAGTEVRTIAKAAGVSVEMVGDGLEEIPSPAGESADRPRRLEALVPRCGEVR